MKEKIENKNYKSVILIALVVIIFIATYCLRLALDNSVRNSHPQHEQSQRIVALAPSLVEVVYQLELDDQLVGVSRFCKYPADAATKPIVGGYLDLDFEAVLKLKPDYVILLEEQKLTAERLNQLGVRTIMVDHASTDGILSSIELIGNNLGKNTEAKTIVQNLQARIQSIPRHTQEKPRVLVCISRDTTSSHPDRIIAAGNAGVHQEYITLTGGINAYQGNIAFPAISREKLIQLNPDVIIELVDEETWKNLGKEKLLQQWAAYSELKAVQNQNVIFLYENKHVIPGPRFVDTLEAFAAAIQSLNP